MPPGNSSALIYTDYLIEVAIPRQARETMVIHIKGERKSKDSTYKFALLRGTIDIIQNSPNLKELKHDLRVYYPMGLLVMKWIAYYFPLFMHDIPQLFNKFYFP